MKHKIIRENFKNEHRLDFKKICFQKKKKKKFNGAAFGYEAIHHLEEKIFERKENGEDCNFKQNLNSEKII